MPVGEDYVTLKGSDCNVQIQQTTRRVIVLRKYREPGLSVVIGIGALALMIWVYVDTSSYMLGECSVLFFSSVYILMAVGFLMISVGLLGCFGASQKSPRVLGTFTSFLPLIMVTALLAGINAVIYQDQVRNNVADDYKFKIINEYGINEKSSLAVDALQKKFECCGATGIADWSVAVFNNASAPGQAIRVPQSCCNQEFLPACNNYSEFNSEGCVDVVKKKVDDRFAIVMAVGFTIAIYEIASFIYSMLVFCALNGHPRCSRRYYVA